MKAEEKAVVEPLPTVLILLQGGPNDNLEAVFGDLKKKLRAGNEAEIFPAPGLTCVELSEWLALRQVQPPVSGFEEQAALRPSF